MFPIFLLRSHERVWLFKVCLLILFWLLGLITGVFFAATASANSIQLLGDVIKSVPSLLGLIMAFCAPIVVCDIGIMTDCFPLCCSVVAVDSLCRGFCGFLVYIFCGSGAWMLRAILMFSSTTGAVLLWWVLLRYCVYGKSNFRNDACVSIIFSFLLIVVDRLLVSPFLIRLSMYF